MKKVKLTKIQKVLRDEYLKDRNNPAVQVKVNLAGGLQKIGLGGTINE